MVDDLCYNKVCVLSFSERDVVYLRAGLCEGQE